MKRRKTVRKPRWATLQELLDELDVADAYWKVGFFALLIGGVAHFYFIFLFLFLKVWILSAVNLISVGMYGYAICGLLLNSLHLRKRDEQSGDATIGWIVFVELLAHNTLASYYLGRDAGFAFYIYTFVGLPFFVNAYRKPIYFLQKFVAIAVAFWVLLCHCFDANKTALAPSVIGMMYHINLLLFLVISGILSYTFAIKLHHHQRELEEEIERDPLTLLRNRRYILRNRLNAHSAPYAVVLFRVERLEHINDNYGYLCGDRVLQHVSSILYQGVHDRGEVYRWDGVEFLLVFDLNDRALNVHGIVEEVRRNLANDPVRCENVGSLSVAVSAAIACDPRQKSTFSLLLKEAEDALDEGGLRGWKCVDEKEDQGQ